VAGGSRKPPNDCSSFDSSGGTLPADWPSMRYRWCQSVPSPAPLAGCLRRSIGRRRRNRSAARRRRGRRPCGRCGSCGCCGQRHGRRGGLRRREHRRSGRSRRLRVWWRRRSVWRFGDLAACDGAKSGVGLFAPNTTDSLRPQRFAPALAAWQFAREAEQDDSS
jgi:hypothetical protein